MEWRKLAALESDLIGDGGGRYMYKGRSCSITTPLLPLMDPRLNQPAAVTV